MAKENKELLTNSKLNFSFVGDFFVEEYGTNVNGCTIPLIDGRDDYCLLCTKETKYLRQKEILSSEKVDLHVVKMNPEGIICERVAAVSQENIQRLHDEKIKNTLIELGFVTETGCIRDVPNEKIEEYYKKLQEVFTVRSPEWETQFNEIIEKVPAEKGNSHFIIPLAEGKALSLAGGREVDGSDPSRACDALHGYSAVSAMVVDYQRDSEGNIIVTGIDNKMNEKFISNDIIPADVIPVVHEVILQEIQKDKNQESVKDVPSFDKNMAEVHGGKITLSDLEDLSYGFDPDKKVGKTDIGGKGR